MWHSDRQNVRVHTQALCHAVATRSRRVLSCGAVWLTAIAAALALSACSDDNTDGGHGHNDTTTARTVLVYMVAENSLSAFATYTGVGQKGDINEMLDGVSALSDNDRMVVYLDDVEAPRLYVLTNKTEAKNCNELVPVATFDESCATDTTTLRRVLDIVARDYAADEYGIVLWSHGAGWMPSTYKSAGTATVRRRSFGIDNGNNTNSNNGPQMEIEDLAAVLASGPRMRFVMFDACFMQCAEVDYALRHVTDYVIASPAEIPGDGAPYAQIMQPMFADTLDVQGIIDNYVADYPDREGAVLSVVRSDAMEDLAAATRRVIAAHRDTLMEMDYRGVLDYFDYNIYHNRFTYPDFYDLQGIMLRLLAPEKSSEGGEEYATWKTALDAAVPFRRSSARWYSIAPQSTIAVDQAQYGGMSMFVPLEKYAGAQGGLPAAWLETGWGKAVWR